MQEIPDTGGGLSGFIAWLLWQVYVYFPFEEDLDWLLLIVFLGVLTRGIMIPVWWRLVKHVARSETSRLHILDSLVLSDLLWPWLVIWLFNTAAGRTFLLGRLGRPLAVAGDGMYNFGIFYHCIVCVAMYRIINWSDSRGSLATLAVFLAYLAMFHSIIAALAQGFYWYWSVGSLWVFCLFSFTAAVPTAVRGLLVYLSK